MSDNDHPLHPAFVHYPIAFLSASYFLDVAYGLATHPTTSSITASIYDVKPLLGPIALSSHYLNIVGILSAIPAIMTGVPQLLALLKKQDVAAKFERSQDKAQTAQKMHPKVKVVFAHAALMDLTVVASVYNWWTRRNNVAFVPDSANMIISANLLLALFGSAYLGGQLVYDYGVGVRRVVGGRQKEQ